MVLGYGDDGFDPYMCETDDVFIEVDGERISGSFEVAVHAGQRLTPARCDRLLGTPLAAIGCRIDALAFAQWDGSDEDARRVVRRVGGRSTRIG